MNKGDRFEKEVSTHFHRRYTPVLISSIVLRSRGLGQIDMGYIHNKKVYAAECKSYQSRVSPTQFKRLSAASQFVSLVLARPVHLIGIQQVAKVNAGDYPFKVCNIRELM